MRGAIAARVQLREGEATPDLDLDQSFHAWAQCRAFGEQKTDVVAHALSSSAAAYLRRGRRYNRRGARPLLVSFRRRITPC